MLSLPGFSGSLPPGTVRLPDGSQKLPNGMVLLPNGIKLYEFMKLPDGSTFHFNNVSNYQMEEYKDQMEHLSNRRLTDHTFTIGYQLTDGSKLLPNGNLVLKNGQEVSPDGSSRSPDGQVRGPDGKLLPAGTQLPTYRYDNCTNYQTSQEQERLHLCSSLMVH